MPYFFHIVKEQPITPGQKPEANRAPRRRSLLDSLPATRASGGAGRDRTDDPLLAKQVLSQLSYSPVCSDQRSAVSSQQDPPSALLLTADS